MLRGHLSYRFILPALVTVLSVWCLVCPISILAQDSQTSDEYSEAYAQNVYQLLLAELAISREEYDNALALYIHLADQNHNEDIYKNAIGLAVSLQANEVAEQLVHQWQESAPESVEAKIYKVRLLIMDEQFAKAKQMLDQISGDQQYQDEITYLKSLILIEMHHMHQALSLLTALDDTQFHSEASFFAGQIYQMQNKTDKAIQWYKKVIDGKYLFPAKLRLSILYIKQGHYTKAMSLLKHLKANDPKQKLMRLSVLADVQMATGENEQAITTLAKALQLSPGDSGLLYMRGLAYANLGKMTLAEADFEQVLAQEPDNPDVLNAYGYALTNHTHQYQRAYKLIKKALKQSPDSPAILDSMGWVLYKMGKKSKALACLKKAYELFPVDEISAHYAVVLNDQGDQHRFEQVIDHIHSLHPDNKRAIDILKSNNISINAQ